jgi:hypothetical protein
MVAELVGEGMGRGDLGLIQEILSYMIYTVLFTGRIKLYQKQRTVNVCKIMSMIIGSLLSVKTIDIS